MGTNKDEGALFTEMTPLVVPALPLKDLKGVFLDKYVRSEERVRGDCVTYDYGDDDGRRA